jgi:hypothetical protein
LNNSNSLTFASIEVSRDDASKIIILTVGNIDPENKSVDIEIKLAGNLDSKKGFAVFHGATLTYTAVEVFTGPFADQKWQFRFIKVFFISMAITRATFAVALLRYGL